MISEAVISRLLSAITSVSACSLHLAIHSPILRNEGSKGGGRVCASHPPRPGPQRISTARADISWRFHSLLQVLDPRGPLLRPETRSRTRETALCFGILDGATLRIAQPRAAMMRFSVFHYGLAFAEPSCLSCLVSPFEPWQTKLQVQQTRRPFTAVPHSGAFRGPGSFATLQRARALALQLRSLCSHFNGLGLLGCCPNSGLAGSSALESLLDDHFVP